MQSANPTASVKHPRLALIALAATALAAVLAAPAADAGETLAIGVSYVQDGSCGSDGLTYLDAAYDRAGGDFEAHADVRVAPHGGDCREDATAYSLELERSWPLTGRIQGLAKFLASEHAQTSPYAQVGADGVPLLRDDGQALFPVHLPSGTAKAVGGVVGISIPTTVGEWDLGVNLVPQPFAAGDERTLHVGWTHVIGDFGLRVSAEVGGPETLSDASLTWTRGNLQIDLAHVRGLNALTDGAPATQEIEGAQFLSVGSPKNSMWKLAFRYAVTL